MSQRKTFAGSGAWSDCVVSTSESESSTRPAKATTTASRSSHGSRLGCPCAVTSARTAMPEAPIAWTSESGASRSAAT